MSSQRWPLAKTWTRWTKQAGLGVAGASGLAPSVFLTRKAILMDSGSMKDVPLVSGMADPRGCGGEGAQRAGEVLHVMPRRHVAGVACFQLVVQALHQLILGSGGDYLHACLYTRILTRTAKENYSSRAYIDVRPVRIAFCGAKPCKTSYYSRVYFHIRPGVIAFCGAKTVQKKLSPRRSFFYFF